MTVRIKVVNPNTSAAMTRNIHGAARAVAAPGTTIEATSPAMGPASIESHYDEALSVPGVLTEIAAGERSGVDGYVLACFGDPGLDAARELATGPVVGIAEAAMRTATYLGRTFTVVTTLARTRGRAWDLAERYGVTKFCAGVHDVDIPVLELDQDPDTLRKLTEACASAIAADDADAVVLGCAGMADLCADLTKALGVPVIDGVRAATLQVQSLITMALATDKRGEYAKPPAKAYSGLLSTFTSPL
ncbi:aspartate/glutamate racemase family protein [Umezawaea endophytica]|uniref:Hydantoin racemase n=1 Tax=Umezawaea endophytica TaxID=1654476 RepID=A0A9X2VKH7_9PSEU|nr:aspartate/glutamate racemase family protein [Umezawaea endophytica]MCS7478069.1 aspartate/glutamate racemase family protein [Umezawaea endophytica]